MDLYTGCLGTSSTDLQFRLRFIFALDYSYNYILWLLHISCIISNKLLCSWCSTNINSGGKIAQFPPQAQQTTAVSLVIHPTYASSIISTFQQHSLVGFSMPLPQILNLIKLNHTYVEFRLLFSSCALWHCQCYIYLQLILNDLCVFSGNLDKQTERGNTALHYCCIYEKHECLKLLLRGKPATDISKTDRQTHIHIHIHRHALSSYFEIWDERR